jgi:PAS domain S-box-containing protein
MATPGSRLDDPQRLEALRASGLLDTPAEEAFDRLTRLVTRVLGVPVGLVTLVDGDRQFFKSCVGLPEPWASKRGTPLTHSFCQYIVSTGEPLVIDDARQHPQLRENLAIPDLGVIAYAGIPLKTADGHTIGTFCAIDSKPRHWSERDLETLRDLAASAATEIDLRLTLAGARQSAEELDHVYREREELLSAVADGIYTIDEAGRFLYVNPAASAMLGYDPGELLGRNAHGLIHHSRPDGTPYPEAECPIYLATQSGNAAHVTEEVLWRRDGTPLPVAYASSPVRRNGTVIGAVVRFTDISETRRATEGLRLLAEAGRLLSSSLDLETTLEAVARLALPQLAEMAMVDVIEDGIIRRVAASHADERSAALFERARAYPPKLGDGGPQDEAIRTGRSVLVRNVDDAWLRQTARGPEHGEVLRQLSPSSVLVVPLCARDNVVFGSVAFVRLTGRSPFDDQDKELAEEIGRRAALAVENARLYEAARRATRARDDMLGVVSHDLRNPIHSIYMGGSFLLDLLPTEGHDLERTQAAVIKRAAERANRLIQDLLDMTHIESGRLSIDIRPHEAASLVDEAVEQARMQATEQKITLGRGDVDDAIAHVDRDRVLQLLGNLVGNALKFTPRGGRVTVSARARPDGLHFSVADTGPGVPAEHVPHLFDRYWQANRKDRRGVGLGLSIVKGIAEAHGGEVRVDTKQGEGSTFTLVLPPRAPAQRAARPAFDKRPDGPATQDAGRGAQQSL